jgi:hypothetical protein
MTYDLSHLPVSVRPQAFGSADDRIRQVHTAHWVGYPRANLFLEHFERLFRHPARTRIAKESSTPFVASAWIG